MKIILASASPRRKALMQVLGLNFEIIVSECDETIDNSLPVCEIVKQLSLKKALAVSEEIKEDALIIGADTVVAYNDCILGKPKDTADAKNMLNMLSGKTHHVYTGFTIIRTSDKKIISDFEKTDVTFKTLTENEIENYIATKDPMDKAGSYSIQGIASSFVTELKGDYNNVVGLPIYKLSRYLYNTFNIANTI